MKNITFKLVYDVLYVQQVDPKSDLNAQKISCFHSSETQPKRIQVSGPIRGLNECLERRCPTMPTCSPFDMCASAFVREPTACYNTHF